MEKVFGEILGSGFGSDSIMLRLVRSSMDKAHENVQAKEGSIDLLNARSKFYELAMILVEGCSELVQEKAEIPETNREKMLLDLMESRNMVRGRLDELNNGILEKDRELMERLETEWKLRQALELKERELVHLRAKLHVEISKIDRLEEENFCELKNSVDQQVWSIKQKLGDERFSLTSDEHLELIPTSHLSRQEQNVVIEQMSSDIDGLKGTLDLAFGKMQNVEIRPIRWKIEKEIILILYKGFMGNLRDEIELELENRSKQDSFGFLNKHWLELINEITSLHQELEPLCSTKENEEKRVEEDKDSSSSSIFLRRTTSEPPPEFDFVKEPPQDGSGGGGGSNYVAKMVKNHESIIRKHQQELNKLKREILQENESFSVGKLKGPNNLATRIHEVTARLNNIIRWNSKIGDLNSVYQERKYMRLSSFRDFQREKVVYHDEIRKLKQERDESDLQIMMLQETYEILFKGLAKDFCSERYDREAQSVIRDDVQKLFLREVIKNQARNSKIEEETRISEEMLLIIYKEIIEEYRKSLEEINQYRYDWEAQEVIRDDVHKLFLREMINTQARNSKIEEENQISEEMLLIIFKEIIEEYRKSLEEINQYRYDWEARRVIRDDVHELFLREMMNNQARNSKIEEENQISEEMLLIIFKEIIEEYRKRLEEINQYRYDWEARRVIRDDVHKLFLREMMNNQARNSKIEEENQLSEEMLLLTLKEITEEYRQGFEEIHQIRVDQEVVAEETFLKNELKEEIQTMYLKDTMKQWKMEFEDNEFETFIRVDLFKILLAEAVRECEASYQENSEKNEFLVLERGGERNLTRKLDSLLKCLEAEEDLIHKASSEIKEHKKDNEIAESEEMDERDAIEWLLTEEDSTFSSVGIKLEKALQLVVLTKALVKELQESVSSSTTTGHESDNQREKHIRRMKPSDGMLFLCMGFEQFLGMFEGVVNQKIEQHFPRLEAMSRKMHKLSQNVDSLRKRELLYKQAFTIRCHNLILAETEVDLLGDQVDALQGLLGKIYLTLEHHSAVLSSYFQVSDFLELIKKELEV